MKYQSEIIVIEKVTDKFVEHDGGYGWELSNFEVKPKVGEIWCIVTKWHSFHMAFKVE